MTAIIHSMGIVVAFKMPLSTAVSLLVITIFTGEMPAIQFVVAKTVTNEMIVLTGCCNVFICRVVGFANIMSSASSLVMITGSAGEVPAGKCRMVCCIANKMDVTGSRYMSITIASKMPLSTAESFRVLTGCAREVFTGKHFMC